MPSRIIDQYELEYEGLHLPEKEGWGAFVTVYGPSSNPMHRHSIIPQQHVSVTAVFPTQQLAEAEAYRVAMAMLQGHRTPPAGSL